MAELLPETVEAEFARDRYFPAQLAVVGALLLYIALPDKLTLAPDWLVPGLEALLLLVLVVNTPWGRRGRFSEAQLRNRRRATFAVTLLAAVANVTSLAFLLDFVIHEGQIAGYRLVLSGVELWATNVLIFAVAYWELDGGGPESRRRRYSGRKADFLFTQTGRKGFEGWRPTFLDYLYTSFTNCTAFSPTDTMPLTTRVKMLMLVQGLTALTTIGVVVARAVSLLD
jgi:uncharacterized membrane protein